VGLVDHLQDLPVPSPLEWGEETKGTQCEAYDGWYRSLGVGEERVVVENCTITTQRNREINTLSRMTNINFF
jgi:hypothetical protein